MNFVKHHPPLVIHVTTVDVTLYAFRDILKHIRQYGFRVVGVCAPGSRIDEIEQSGTKVNQVPMTRRITPLPDLIALIRLTQIFFTERPAIVQTHTPKANLLGQWAAWMMRVPVRICTIHGLYFTPATPLPRRWLLEWMERLTTLPATHVWLINNEDVRTATARHICSAHKIRLLDGGFGIDLEKFNPEHYGEDVRLQVRNELGWTSEHCVIGFVGRLVREKGLDELFSAIASIRSQVPNLRLLVVGPIDTAKPDAVTPQIAKQHGVDDICSFTGSRTDMGRLYTAMDIFVLPSYREGLPLSIMEAQAMGLPVITTNARGCSESVIPGFSGLVVPVRNVKSLADAILSLGSSTLLRQEMGANARKLALVRFDRRRVSYFHTTEYQTLLQASSQQ